MVHSGQFWRRAMLAVSGMVAPVVLTTVAASAATVSCTPATGQLPRLRVTGYSAATVRDTSSPIPAGALFVANGGNDHNRGTIGSPLASIHKAIGVAHNGGTIVLRGGLYRESLGTLRQRVTIQAYPHESPWVTGSVAVRGFARHGGAWTVGWSSPLCDTCYPSAAIDPLHPAAGLPEQVFVDGVPLAQVTTRAALKAHTFYVDHTNRQLVLADDPTGHSVEVTKLATALLIGPAASGTTIRGIGFEHWGSTYQGVAAITVTGNRVTLDSDTFAWSAARALGIFGANDVVSHSLIVDNGMTGVNAHADRGIDFEHNEVAFSNLEHWSIAPSLFAAVAGVKNTNSRDSVYRSNYFHDNDSNALWFDQDSARQTVVDNMIVRNSGHGLIVEISGDSILAGNVVADNGRDGLKLSGASNVDVWNNTVVGNGWAQARVDEDSRHTTGPVTLANNIFIAGSRSIMYVLYSYDIDQPGHLTTLQIIAADDHNVYGRTNTRRPIDTFLAQTTPNVCSTYRTLDAFRNTTHRETASMSADGWPLSRTFTDSSHENYRIVPGATLPQPTTLPHRVAAALHTSTHVDHVGA